MGHFAIVHMGLKLSQSLTEIRLITNNPCISPKQTSLFQNYRQRIDNTEGPSLKRDANKMLLHDIYILIT